MTVKTLMIALALIVATAAVAKDVRITHDGKPMAVIVVSGELADSPARAKAVSELNYHIEKMSGTPLDVVVVNGDAAVPSPAIVLGEQAVKLGAEVTKTSPSQEGFRVLAASGRVLIAGETDAAVLHGVYTFLEHLGCAWVMPGEIGEVIPERQSVVVGELDIASAPAFQVRALWYRGYNKPRLPEEKTRMAQWLGRQRGGRNWDTPYFSTSGHVWDRLIAKHKDEFAEDPTMLALRRLPDGTVVRRGPQLEATHPAVVKLFADDIKATYAKNIAAGKWTADTPAGFGIGPADGLGYSESAEAMLAGSGRIDPIVGETDRTDELILLGNRILEAVQDEYPNCYVGCYSYSTHADFPKRYKPNPNIVQIFAPINFSRFHSVIDPNSKTQAYYRGVVEQWGRLSREQGNPLLYRGYNWNLAENMLPYSKVRIWGEELPFYHEHQILGLNVEATKAWSINGPSDYVFMKLAWDPTLRWQDVLRDYCATSFGAGGEAMEQYLLSIIETQHGAGQEAGSYHAFHLIYDQQWVTDKSALLTRALAAAKREDERTRIGHFVSAHEALRLYLTYHAATQAHDFVAAKAGYDAMMAHWQTTYDQNTDLVANESPAYLKRFIKSFVETGLTYSSAPYTKVADIPDELITVFDPLVVGHRLRYHAPEINDSGFVRTRTYSTTWDAQGLTGMRSGAVWYRYRFVLPPADDEQPVGLFIGGVEDEARVWINGKAIGTSGRRFSAPFVFDLTDGYKPGEENVLAIQIIRNSKANEIGLGGILRPCFIFRGPRLETPAPEAHGAPPRPPRRRTRPTRIVHRMALSLVLPVSVGESD